MKGHSGTIAGTGLLVGLALNVTGWLGNNVLLRSMWATVVVADAGAEWRASAWRDVLSLVPDFVYGGAIAWLCWALRPGARSMVSSSLGAGLAVSIVGGVTTYFAVADSGFIPWPLAMASFALVLATKVPFAFVAGWILERHWLSVAAVGGPDESLGPR